MYLENFPKKAIAFVDLFDGRLKGFGIDTEVDGLSGKLIAPNSIVTAVEQTANGGCKFVGKMPAEVKNAIARQFNLDFLEALEGTHVAVEGPSVDPEDWSGAHFITNWLRAAIDCDRLLQSYSSENRSFRERIARVAIAFDFEFAPAAVAFIRKWQKDGCSFSLDMREQWAEIFMVMVAIGFFAFVEDRYQMVIPAEPNIEVITEALIHLAETEDEHCYLHPGRHLVTTMPCVVKETRKRLRDLRNNLYVEVTAGGWTALASADNGTSCEPTQGPEGKSPA